MVAKPERYQWSCYQSYIGQCATPEWLKTGFILGYFGGKASDAKNSYRRFVEDLLDREYESSLTATVASTVLGRSAFVRELSERHLGEKRAERRRRRLGRFLASFRSPRWPCEAASRRFTHRARRQRPCSTAWGIYAALAPPQENQPRFRPESGAPPI